MESPFTSSINVKVLCKGYSLIKTKIFVLYSDGNYCYIETACSVTGLSPTALTNNKHSSNDYYENIELFDTYFLHEHITYTPFKVHKRFSISG